MDSSSSDDEVNEEVNVDQTVIPDIQEEKTKLNSLKILKDIKSICNDEVSAAAAYRVYLDLCEVRKYEEVSYHFKHEINQIYLLARRKKDDPAEIVIPILSMKKYSFKDFEEFQNAFDTDISIAIYDSSAVAIYKLNKS